jgi:NAD(P)-dependent dehydrogenase (short-subunit alcohol dehydrogenase family)
VKLFREKQLPLHVLVNNAGVFNTRGTTKEGFELIWGTNYLGHFLLTNLLMEKLLSSAPSRIIMVSSDLALRPTSINWDLLVKKTPLNFLELYAVSKLCLLLLTMELARHLDDTNVTVNAVHPGFVQSNITLGHRLSKYLGLGLSPEDGASSLLACATSSAFEGVSGKFFDHQGKEMRLSDLAKDAELAKQLWERSWFWTGGDRQKPTTPTKPDRKKGVSSLPPSTRFDRLTDRSGQAFQGESSKNFSEFQAPSDDCPANPKSRALPIPEETSGTQRPKIQNPKSGDAAAEIWGPYSLGLNNTEIASITKTILEKVLPKPPRKLLFLQLLSLGVKFQFGSLFLLLVQYWKKEFHMERHLDSDAVCSLCQDEKLLQKLKEYLGEEFVLWRSEIWANYPSQQLIPFWHQDSYPKLLQGTGKTINIYMALTEVNGCNGFEYIPASRLTHDVSVKMTDPFSGNCFFELTEELERQAVPVVLRPGEFVLFTDQLIHRSIRNTTGKVRLALTLRVTEPNVRIVSSYSTV